MVTRAVVSGEEPNDKMSFNALNRPKVFLYLILYNYLSNSEIIGGIIDLRFLFVLAVCKFITTDISPLSLS